MEIGDVQKKSRDHLETETLATKSASFVLSTDVLMKFSYFTALLPKIKNAKLKYCFRKSLLSADDF